MTFIELFAGIGGFRRGLENAGFTCIGYVEWDKFARQSYEAIWPKAKEEWSAHDITAVKAEEIPQADLWAFGSPCQDLSVAGKRAGFAGERSGLFLAVIRLLQETPDHRKPRYLLFENVVGLLSSNKGWDFLVAQVEMANVGYDTEYEIFNATDFGIPQNRERVFLVGHLRSRGRGEIFPLRVDDTKITAELECVGMLDMKGQENIRRVYSPTGISPTLTTMGGGNLAPKILELTKAVSQTQRVYDPLGVAPTLRHGSEVTGNISPMIQVSAVLTPDREEKRQNGRRIKEHDEPMFTLTAQDKHGVMVSYNRKDGIGEPLDEALTLNASDWRGLNRNQTQNAVVQRVGNTNPSGNGMNGNVFDADGLAPTLTTNKGEGSKIMIGGVEDELSGMRKTTSKKEVQERSVGGFGLFQETKILQSGVHEQRFYGTNNDAESKLVCGTRKSEENSSERTLRGMRCDGECGCSSQGRELAEQRPAESTTPVSLLSSESTQTEKDMQDMRSETQGSRVVRETPATDEEVRRSNDVMGKTNVRIRKLTPLETWRLMGREDWEHEAAREAGVSDSQRYKQAGNSLIPQIVEAIGRKIQQVERSQP